MYFHKQFVALIISIKYAFKSSLNERQIYHNIIEIFNIFNTIIQSFKSKVTFTANYRLARYIVQTPNV